MATTSRASVEALRTRPTADFLVIGGGVNGVGIFRDLALQGADVVLVERADYASGASSASSHMIHGGVRYLENGELRLVKESVVERNGLLKIASHAVKPLPTVIPIFSTFSGLLSAPLRLLTHKAGKPKERGAFLIKVGLIIYDFFSRDGGSVPRHVFHGRKKSLAARPDFPSSIKYTATYYDASVHDPERLVLDILWDGIDNGGRASNYVSAVGFTGNAVTVRDEITGDEFDITAKTIINVSGSWTDLTNEALGAATTYMGGTKGSHIILDNPELLQATGKSEIFFENSDGRIVLIYPFRDRVMVGTTDLDADPREITRCTEAEVDYFFGLVGKVFPTITVDRSQIVYRFSGIRPLPRHGDLEPGFVSRDYRVVESALGSVPLLSVVGGKLTTFRALAEHVSRDALALHGEERMVTTARMPIGGARDFPRDDAGKKAWAVRHGAVVGEVRADRLLRRYGTTAAAFIATVTQPEAMLTSTDKYSREEITWLARTYQVVRLVDVIQRRTSIAMAGRATDEVIDEVADVVAEALGWSDDERDEQRAHAREYLADVHGLTNLVSVP